MLRLLTRPNLPRRLCLYGSALSLVPILILGITADTVARRAVDRHAERAVRQSLTVERDAISRHIDTIARTVVTLAGHPDLVGAVADPAPRGAGAGAAEAAVGFAPPDAAAPTIRRLRGHMVLEGVIGIDVVAGDGRRLAVGRPPSAVVAERLAALTRPGAPALPVGSVTWVEVTAIAGPGPDEGPVIAAVAPILDADRAAAHGVVGLRIDAGPLRRRLAETALAAGGDILVVGWDGRLVVHPTPDRIGMPPDPIVAGYLGPEPRTGQVVIDGAAMRVVTLPLSRFGGWMVGVVPVAALTAPVAAIRSAALAALVICLVLVGGIAFAVSRDIVRPIQRISTGLRALRQAPAAWPPPLPVVGDDEIAALSHGYNDLCDALIQRQQAVDALRDSEARYSLAMRAANDGLWDWNLETGDLSVSPRWKAMVGHHETAGIGGPEVWLDRVHPEDRHRVLAELHAHLEGETPVFESEHRMRRIDGREIWVFVRGLAVRDDAGRPVRLGGAHCDITARRHIEAQLRHDALHDPLTGLPNRVMMLEKIRDAIARRRRDPHFVFAVLFVDLDGFKSVNDSFGHTSGDAVLIAVAGRLRRQLRDVDALGRLGGDEFAILLNGLREVTAVRQVATRLLAELRLPHALGGTELVITASIGIAFGDLGYDGPEALVRDADIAMYRAKTAGKASFEVFDQRMRQRIMHRVRLEAELRQAISAGDLVLYYQPVVEIATGVIVGVEALVRWQHAERGLLPPGAFISIAEDSGLIGPLEAWVLGEACRQTREWHRLLAGAAPPPMVNVNLSPRRLAQPGLVQEVDRTLAETGLGPSYLGFEITESATVYETRDAVETLDRLKDRGVRLYIDDFGTGYSSLSYLHAFRIDGFKIDRSFVERLRDVGHSPSHSLVRTILLIGQELGATVVAEGIEHPVQLDRLRALGCRYGQGFLFGRPQPAAAITMRLCGPLGDRALADAFGPASAGPG